MKLILASFGLGTADVFAGGDQYTLTKFGGDKRNLFLRMPAIAMNRFGSRFLPDYPVFLLFDKFTVDHHCYELAAKYGGTGDQGMFADLWKLLRALKASGRLEVASFEDVLKPYQLVIDRSVEYDLQHIEVWADAFQLLYDRWQAFRSLTEGALEAKGLMALSDDERELKDTLLHCELGMVPTPDGLDILDAIKRWKRNLPDEVRARTRLVVRDYLRYVTSNLCLAHALSGVVHEWADIEPLCLQKLKFTARLADAGQTSINAIRQLFELMIPDYGPQAPEKFVRALDDNRVESLRTIVEDAAVTNRQFDQAFYNSVMRDVLTGERRTARARRLTGWWTLPLSFIPVAGSAVQRATEETIGKVIDNATHRDHQWFFLVSDLAQF